MYQTVNQLVGQMMLQLGPLSFDKRTVIRSYAIDFLYKYRNTVEAALQVYATANIPHSLIIPFPDDYISWSSVGWVVDGQVKLVAENKNIARNMTLNQKGVYTGVQANNYLSPMGNPVPGVQQYVYPYGYGYGPAGTGTVSGAMIPELNGFFTEDRDNRVIRLSSVVQFPNFYMVYVSDCFKATDDYLIHPYAYNCAKEYIRWSYLRDKPDVPAWKVREAALQLDNEMLEMKKNINGLSAFDILTLYNKWLGENE